MLALSQLSKYLKLPATSDGFLQAQRLFHGRGHAYEGLHHVTVDWLPPVVLITLFSPERYTEIEALVDWLLPQLPACRSVQLQHRYELSGPIDVLRGDAIQ